MEFEIPLKQKVKVKIEGVVYEVSKPTVSQMEAVVSIEDSSAKEKYLLMIKFLVNLGLKEEIVKALEVEQMNLLIEFLVGSVKKN